MIRKWLRAPIEIKGKPVKRRKGLGQGSPLSPILSNILLTELDREMERRGLKRVRYADDFSIYCREEAEARKVGNEIYLYLRDKLKLPINREKSGIRRPDDFTLPGYGFEHPAKEEGSPVCRLKVSEKGVRAFKKKLKEITRKTTPRSISVRTGRLSRLQRGWLEYFRPAHMHRTVKNLDGRVRRRLRYCIWHDWRKPKRRRKNLIRLGAKPDLARKWGNSSKGGWRIAGSAILQTTVTTKRLRQRGYQAMLPVYESITPYPDEPLYTRPVRTVV